MSEIVQGSPEWHAIRCGRVTASRISAVVAKTKTGVSATRATYMGELLAERLTGQVSERFKSPAMQWGNDTEADARAAYSFYSGQDVVELGFAVHPTISQSGASPDGLVGEYGLVEIKCPNTSTHIATLLGGNDVPSEYRTQIHWQLACTGRQWCDFVSFDPRLPEHMRLFVRRIDRCDQTIADLETEVRKFLAELDATIAELRAKFPAPEQLAA
jgi:putative phage-type endonuclease